jgi:MFS family permease
MIPPWLQRLLPPDDLLRQAAYRRLFTSILMSSLGAQVTMLAVPLTAALLLHASPLQMGLLTAMEIAPFVLFSLPAGVWLDRVRKLPVYIAGECMLALAVFSVPLSWWLGWLGMPLMYAAAFVIGSVHTVAGSAAQIVLTQVVPRERLVEAHAKNALAGSGAEVVGPGLAGVLIKAVGAPLALLVDAVTLLASALVLRGVHVRESVRPGTNAHFWRDLQAGLRFVRTHALLMALALCVGLWQMCHHAALVVQILYATRTLGMSEQAIGLAFVALGGGSVLTGVFGHRVSQRFGPGPALVMGVALCGLGWLQAALASGPVWGVAAFALMLTAFGVGATLIFINFLALRQAVTPAPLLGRMTSTMRWLILLPAGPGALLGGWVGEQLGLRAALAMPGVVALLLAAFAWRNPVIRGVKTLPSPEPDDMAALGAEAELPEHARPPALSS